MGDRQTVIRDILARTPHWIRQDLGGREGAARERAEEALAAMIADALGKLDSPDRPIDGPS